LDCGTLDGKVLAQAKRKLEARRRQNQKDYDIHLQEVYNKSPRVYELDIELRNTMLELTGIALGISDAQQIEAIRCKNLKLQEERKNELTKTGYPADYLDESVLCTKCNDTGYIKSKICDCLIEFYKEEQKESLSNLFKLGHETFSNFKLSYYDDTLPETGVSPRKSMELVYETCIEYARKFGKNSRNLFFNGNTGLGKTYLSACIARVVSENGYSVVYDMAGSIFSKFEDAKFSRTENTEERRNDIKRYLECDFLIIDDLGTEMTTAFTVSALYEIINTRLVTSKKTLVSSNLTLNELEHRYTRQIMSRLEGEYQVLTFYGDDIRKKKLDQI